MKDIVTVFGADGSKKVVQIGVGKGGDKGERCAYKARKLGNEKNKSNTLGDKLK